MWGVVKLLHVWKGFCVRVCIYVYIYIYIWTYIFHLDDDHVSSHFITQDGRNITVLKLNTWRKKESGWFTGSQMKARVWIPVFVCVRCVCVCVYVCTGSSSLRFGWTPVGRWISNTVRPDSGSTSFGGGLYLWTEKRVTSWPHCVELNQHHIQRLSFHYVTF